MAKTVKPPKPAFYRHSSHADWGVGMIVEETSSKVHVAFEDGRRRSFVNVQRYRELLMPAELEAKAAEEIVAKLTKDALALAAAMAEKRPTRKAFAVDSDDEDVAEPEVEADRDEDEEDEE